MCLTANPIGQPNPVLPGVQSCFSIKMEKKKCHFFKTEMLEVKPQFSEGEHSEEVDNGTLQPHTEIAYE